MTLPEPLTLTFSPCPNDTFVFHAWACGLLPGAPAVDVTYHDVDVTNGMAERGERDVLKVSYAGLPWFVDRYALLPSGGALGRGCGPLVVVADGPADVRDAAPRGLSDATVAVPGERTTAYLLLRLWAERVPMRVVVMPFADIMPAVRDGTVDAGLVIHEARFTYQGYGLRCLVDLGEWWEQTTGLPIPLGAIVARRGLDLAAIAGAVRASVEHAWADPAASAAFVAAHAQEMDPDVQRRHIALYVNVFTRDLGEDGMAAACELLGRASAAGLVPPVDPRSLRVV